MKPCAQRLIRHGLKRHPYQRAMLVARTHPVVSIHFVEWFRDPSALTKLLARHRPPSPSRSISHMSCPVPLRYANLLTLIRSAFTWARSYCACCTSQLSALPPKALDNRTAISREMPRFSFTNSDTVVRVTPRAPAA